MLVFGDRERHEDAADIVREISLRLAQWEATNPGIGRHQSLVAAFIRTAELVQSALDAEFHHIGCDELTERQQNGNNLLLQLGNRVGQSWSQGFAAPHPQEEETGRLLETFLSAGPLATRQAEGYAFYALYPEAYFEAAQRSGLGAGTLVIGIRSIGAGLAGMVAAALGAAPAVTVRPVGHPFDRKLSLGKRLSQYLLSHPGDFAIVDEGPGLSGSSFNSVADWLTAHGVDDQRIHFFPSHSGDLGSAAQAAHRQRWSGAKRHVVEFDPLFTHCAEPEHRLENWVADLVGPLSGPLEDISGGNWRGPERSESPADPALERRKFLAPTNRGQWLVKFAGVGGSGEAGLRLAAQLADVGFAPFPKGLCHGFLVMPWLEDQKRPDEMVSKERLFDYLAFRASLPASGEGASLEALFNMAQFNIAQRCGPDTAAIISQALGDPDRFSPVPCCTDNRLHAWEWAKTEQGWLKLDGTDHHASHDLVGCQDIAWDVAGGAVEFGFSVSERDAFAAALSERIGRQIDPRFVHAMQICYLGFQIGLWTMAQGRNNAAEGQRIETLLQRYVQHHALRDLGVAS